MKLLTKVTFGLALVFPALVVDNAGLARAQVASDQGLITVELVATDAYQMREYRIDGVLAAVYVAPLGDSAPYLLVDKDRQANFVRIGTEQWQEETFLEREIFSLLKDFTEKEPVTD